MTRYVTLLSNDYICFGNKIKWISVVVVFNESMGHKISNLSNTKCFMLLVLTSNFKYFVLCI